MDGTDVVEVGMTADQTAALKTSIESAGSSVLANFTSVLPAVASVVAIAFVIYYVTKQINKLKRGR